MKQMMLALTLMAGLVACGHRAGTAVAEAKPVKDQVEVVYFHGKQRCASCIAIEKSARETVETVFADEVKRGRVVFKTVDISTPEGEALADRYEVTWSSLFVNVWRDGRETRHDLTDFAFGNARKNPDAFKAGLSDRIREGLQ